MIHAREDYNRIQDPTGKIPADEPVFLLRAQDRYFIKTVQYYASLLEADKEVDRKIVQQIWQFLRVKVFNWRRVNALKIKSPDLPEEVKA